MTYLPVARAMNFISRDIYHSVKEPGYVCWVGFFPGDNGKWYISCEEVSRPDMPLPGISKSEWYAVALPAGYDKSHYLMEMLILESNDSLKTWDVISRVPCRYHHSPESYAQAKTKDGDFIRFVSEYSRLGENVHPGEILSISHDYGVTWEKQKPFHDSRIFSRPHRLRTLRDGTLVLAIGLLPKYDADMPRTCVFYDENAINIIQMCICYSFDQGISWSPLIPVFGGQSVSETDFVELPSGDLLFINSSIWQYPGSQLVYRSGNVFIPSYFKKSLTPDLVPETVCITEEGLLVGCLRGGISNRGMYAVSDDLGMTWEPLEGIPYCDLMKSEVYQPFIQYLGNGHIACAGHYGGDDPIDSENRHENFIMPHEFDIRTLNRRQGPDITVKRNYDNTAKRWPNMYTLKLTCGKKPLAGRELAFWYAERFDANDICGGEQHDELYCPENNPEYDARCRHTIDERMKLGGKWIKVTTDENGEARIMLQYLDTVRYIHHSIKFVVRFNYDNADPGYLPIQTCQYEFYSLMYHE